MTRPWTKAQAEATLERWETGDSIAAQAYRYMIAQPDGTLLNTTVLGAQLGCSGSNIILVMHAMRAAGYRFRKQGFSQVIAARPSQSLSEAPAARLATVAELPAAPMLPYPPLGADVQVRALALLDDGALAMQLVSEDGRSWRVTVDGHSA